MMLMSSCFFQHCAYKSTYRHNLILLLWKNMILKMTFLIFFLFECYILISDIISFLKNVRKLKVTVISRVKTEYPIDSKQML